MNITIRSIILQLLATGLAGVLHAQTLTDIGSAAPSPGTNDISQLSTQGNQKFPDTLNYYTDNNPPAGQTFTTGTNAMRLVSVAIKTAGLDSGGGYGTPATTPTYYLSIYSMSGSTATLLITVSAPNPGFTDGDWLKWSGLNVALGTNKTYAFAFGRQPSGGGYAALAVATNAYAGGEIALIPISGGTITTGSSHKFDAVFDLGLQPAATNIPASMPWPIPTYGWNLGNTLEATWGVPNFTAAPFYTAANAGFNAVRIPCAWDFNATTNISGGVTNYPINPAFMAKVKQTVDCGHRRGNVCRDQRSLGRRLAGKQHWDNVDPTINAKMNAYWTQIATTFAGYDNHLLFAAANEPNVNNPAEEVTLMYYYQTFVNAVRATGGNNTNRWLVIQSVSDPTWMNALPTDTVSNRLMVEYHSYTPSQFTIIAERSIVGQCDILLGTGLPLFRRPNPQLPLGRRRWHRLGFSTIGRPVCQQGHSGNDRRIRGRGEAVPSTNATEAAWNSASVYYWNKYVAESARGHGLSPFYWSTPGSPFDLDTGAVNDAQSCYCVDWRSRAAAAERRSLRRVRPYRDGQQQHNVILSWTAGSGATSYNLYRAAESGCERHQSSRHRHHRHILYRYQSQQRHHLLLPGGRRQRLRAVRFFTRSPRDDLRRQPGSGAIQF